MVVADGQFWSSATMLNFRNERTFTRMKNRTLSNSKRCEGNSREVATMKLDKTFLIAVMLFILMSCSSIFALTIETQFIGGAAPRNAVGGGNLTDLVNAAARIWESSYSDPSVLTIYYGWGSSTSEAATHTLLTQGGNPNRESAGMILFDNSGNTVFFLDPTPYLNEEYQGKTEEYQTFGGKEINVASSNLRQSKRRKMSIYYRLRCMKSVMRSE
jgi:hypothetical protein